MKLLFAYALFVVALWWGVASHLDKQDAVRHAAVRESILKARLAEAIVDVRVDSVRVVKSVERLRTVRESLLVKLTDTLLLQEFVYRTDTLMVNCLACVASASRLRLASDSSIQFWKLRYESVKPRWRDRCGISPGYGLQAQRSGTVTHGPTLTASCKVWP